MKSEALDLIKALCDARKELIDVHIFMDKSGLFSRTATSLIPFSTEDNSFNTGKLSISLSIDGDFLSWSNVNEKAFGVVLSVSYRDAQWTLGCEYGWSGEMIGWDPLESTELCFGTFDEMIREVHVCASRLRHASISFLGSLESKPK